MLLHHVSHSKHPGLCFIIAVYGPESVSHVADMPHKKCFNLFISSDQLS